MRLFGFGKDKTEECVSVGRELGEIAAKELGIEFGKEFGKHQVKVMDAVKKAGYNEREQDVIEGEFFESYMEKSNHPDRKKYRYR